MPVYFFAAESTTMSPIKIGRSINIDRRKKKLQTGSATILYTLGHIVSDNDADLERSLHDQFHSRRLHGEWFDIDHMDILPVLLKAGKGGFLPCNDEVFEIIGLDNDAIPEYAESFQWIDLPIEQCCPFCGCLCGMQYIEPASMHHCPNCQELTDFSSKDDFE